MQQVHHWQPTQSTPKEFTDADWAGCRDTRKSRKGGCAMLGRRALKGWSKTQFLIALSSGESERYAALTTSAEGLGVIALLKDFGYVVKGEIWGPQGIEKKQAYRYRAAVDTANSCGTQAKVFEGIGEGEPSRLIYQIPRCSHARCTCPEARVHMRTRKVIGGFTITWRQSITRRLRLWE